MSRPNPDDRRDNVENLQNIIDNTIKNKEETEDYLQAHADSMSETQIQQMMEKNKRREQSLQGLREEIKEEAQARRNEID